jgi:NitT/TauT family transport system permease protein/taurine transport system permease protein
VGFLIFESRDSGLIERTIAGMVVIGFMWLFFDRMFLKPFERATSERWGILRMDRR